MGELFKAVIRLDDQTTRQLKKIAAEATGVKKAFAGIAIHSAFMRDLIRTQTHLQAISRDTGIPRLALNLGRAALGVGKLGVGLLKGVLAPLKMIGGMAGLSGLAGLAGVGGMIAMAKSTAEWGEELDKASAKTGVAANELAKLHHIAEAMKIEPEALDKGLVKLNRTLAEAAAGKNKNAVEMFRKLHIGIRDASGQVRTADKVLPQMSDAIQRNGNAAVRTRIAITAFGKSGADLIPLLQGGSAELAKMSAEYERYFGKISPQMMKSMREGAEAFDKAELATKGLKMSIGAALMPAITDLLVPMTEWVAQNRELISSKVGAWAKDVAKYLKGIDWEKVGAGAKEFADDLVVVIKGLRDLVGLAMQVKSVWDALNPSKQTIEQRLNVNYGRQTAGVAPPSKAAPLPQGFRLPSGLPSQNQNFAFGGTNSALFDNRSLSTNIFNRETSALMNVSPYSRPGATANGRPGVAGRDGKITVDVNLSGAPQGTQVRTTKSGSIDSLNLGFAWQQ